MKRIVLFLCFLAHAAICQTPKLDSLKRDLINLHKMPDGHQKDTIRYQILKEIMYDYSDINVDSSADYNTQLIRLCVERKLKKQLIYAYQFSGYLYQVRGDYHQSARFYFKALSLAEELVKPTEIAGSHRGLAHAYFSLKKYEIATVHCNKGILILRTNPNTNVLLGILNVQSAIRRDQKKFAEALKESRKMYLIAHQEREQWYESQGLHTMGWAYMEMGEIVKAIDYFNKALQISKSIRSDDLTGSILLHIAEINFRKKNWQEALKYCNQAKLTAANMKNSSIMAEAEEKRARIFKQVGQFAKAMKAHEAFDILTDSMSKEKTEHRIETLQALYENEQKSSAMQRQQSELRLQKNRNEQLAQTRNGLAFCVTVILIFAAFLYWNNKRLEMKNREIERQQVLLESARAQLADINHTLETRVEDRTKELINANIELIRKNEEIKGALFKGQTIERKRVALELHDNLSSLLGAVNMSIQAINPLNLSNSEQSIYQNLKYLIQNAYAEVRNISHNIFPADFEREGLEITLTTLLGRLNQNSSLHFSLTVNGLLQRLPIEIEFNVYSIILELINNAIKHAQATSVDINLIRTDCGVDVSIIDDGIGIGHYEGKRGVGLQNIQARLDSLGGTMDNLMAVKKGTWIFIKIPIDEYNVNGNILSV